MSIHDVFREPVKMGRANIETRCPKCDNRPCTMRFCQGRPIWPMPWDCKLYGDHIHRICEVCGYRWVAMTRDYPEADDDVSA